MYLKAFCNIKVYITVFNIFLRSELINFDFSQAGH